MSKIFRTAVAATVVAGVAALTPLSAQAKDEPELALNTPLTVESCASATATPASGLVSGTLAAGRTFTVTLPAAVVTATSAYETRARVYTVDAAGKKSFTTKRARVSNISDVGSGQVGPNQHIWRLDVTNLTAEAAGLPALAFTSAGFINCD